MDNRVSVINTVIKGSPVIKVLKENYKSLKGKNQEKDAGLIFKKYILLKQIKNLLRNLLRNFFDLIKVGRLLNFDAPMK